MKLPRCMSTQHPDNVQKPFFADDSVIGGDDELEEAYYVFSQLGITEQLWDFEGKDVDSSAVRKLLTHFDEFFKKNKLGKDRILTYRVPNPDVEKNEGKILLETLESIPRNFDVAKTFYGGNDAPVFEVAVPMVTNAQSIIRIAEYYKKFVVGKESSKLADKTVRDWIGEFSPKSVRIMPLIEDQESMLNAHKIAGTFIKSQKVEDYLRVWLARSDPALNYSSVATVLIEKVALQRLHELSEKSSVDIHPVLGCGSAPFRGNFKPTNVEDNLHAYPSVQTFTLQSAFKYDYPEKVVRNAVETINSTKAKKPLPVNEEKVLPIIKKLGTAYQQQIKLIAPFVNDFAGFVPKRRRRKLHIGLFGYARKSGGVHLPRAIRFTCALYSLGLPPELLGLHVLNDKERDLISHAYPTFENDVEDAAQFVNEKNLDLFPGKVKEQVLQAAAHVDAHIHPGHEKLTSQMLQEFKNKRVMVDKIEKAGKMRGFLG